jgi:hypothetical protein
MKYFFLAILATLSLHQLAAQEVPVPSQAVYAELGGNSLIYSFSYDFRFDPTHTNGWGMQVGAGGYYRDNMGFFTMPVIVNHLFGKEKHFFEVGAGATLMAFRARYVTWQCDESGCGPIYEQNRTEIGLPIHGSPNAMGMLSFGYRRIPVGGGVMWKATLTPMFNSNGFWPLFAGMSVGYAF